MNLNFSKKIFLAIFLSCFFICSIVIWSVNYFITKHEINTFSDRYRVFSKVIGNTLVQLEQNTESLMYNAASVVVGEDRDKGLLSTSYLRQLADRLGITHIFIIDREGRFIRSTNEDPALIPNLFSFCEDYKKLISGTSDVEGTPIIPPEPEPNPYKFLTVPNHNRSRLIEVGVKAEFIGMTLTRALLDDSNVMELNLFAPDGTSLGSYGRQEKQYKRVRADIEVALKAGVVDDNEYFNIFTRVDSTQIHCCQCDNAGLSRNGEYYYILKSKISKKELLASIATFKNIFIGLQVIVFMLSLLLSQWLSKRLVGKINTVNMRVKDILTAKTLKLRVKLKGADEIAVLSQNFDRLLDTLEYAQDQLVKSQREQVLTHTARQLAHDIRSPLTALEVAASQLASVPEEERLLIRRAVQRIQDIANDLAGRRFSSSEKLPVDSAAKEEASVHLLSGLMSALVSEKRLQYRSRMGIEIDFMLNESSYGLFAKIQPNEFKRVLSNVINNSVEAVGNKGKISLTITAADNMIRLKVSDNGRGIPKDVLPQLMESGVTHDKEGGSGLGLYHAKTSVEGWGGEISLNSEQNIGTTVTIDLPKFRPPDWFVPEIEIKNGTTIIILDDDDSIHQVWKGRFDLLAKKYSLNVMHFTTSDGLYAWHRAAGINAPNVLLLCDYELIGQQMCGIDVITSLGLEKKAILVTSYFESVDIRAKCREVGIRLIPKNLVGSVPIKHVNSIGTAPEDCIDQRQVILIDDDELVRQNWSFAARRSKVRVCSFAHPDGFLASATQFDTTTPVYIDSNLSDGIRGEEIARLIHAMGFENIYIETGYDASEFIDKPWIRGVIGKNPPW